MPGREHVWDVLTNPTYEAKRKSFTSSALKTSFMSVGIVPWDRKIVLQLARVKVGVDLPFENVADQARAAAALCIRKAPENHSSDKRGEVEGRASVKTTKVCGEQDLVAADGSRGAEQETTAAVKVSAEAAKVLERRKAAREREEA